MTRMTPEDAAIIHNLKHVPFMAWLAECRDTVDYRAMLAREQDRAEFPNVAGTPRNRQWVQS